MRLAIFFLILVSLSTSLIWAQDSVELRKLADGVIRARYGPGLDHMRTITELNKLAQQISALIEKSTLTPQENAAAYFYRGTARVQVMNLQYFEGKKIDEPLGLQALSDLDKVIADGIEYPQLGASTSEALYAAGSVAKILHSDSRAYSYWEKCAALDHAGCLNIMANARLTGDGHQKVDFHAAINYHLKVFNTGTRYHCAGAYSAQSIAAIGYFTGTATQQGDELDWIKRALDLADQLKAEDKKTEGCELSGMFIDEFLYRLARGDRQDALLDDASAKPTLDANATNAVVGLLSGRLTPNGFSSSMALAKTDLAKCSGYFRGLWYAELIKRHDLAQNYYQHILQRGCATELLFARKFKRPSGAKK
jgi:hypothetical protein